jgi:transcriptional regulator with XRE-family HTH domain
MLVAARHKAGLTQEELAKKLRRPQSFIAKYERGERRLDVVEFLSIAAALEADGLRIVRSVGKLLGGD